MTNEPNPDPRWIDAGRLQDGEASGEEAARLRRSFEDDAELGRVLDDAREVDQWMRSDDPAAELSVDVDSIVARVRDEIDAAGPSVAAPPRVRRPSRHLAGWAALAAAVLLLVWVGSRSFDSGAPGEVGGPSPELADTGNDVTPAGSDADLDNGSRTPSPGDLVPREPSGADRELADTDRERVADASPSDLDRPVDPDTPSVTPPAYDGFRTLVVLDDSWPEQCRQETRATLERRLPEFVESDGAALSSIQAELRRYGRETIPVLTEWLDDVEDDRSRLAFELLLERSDASTFERLLAGAERHGRLAGLVDRLGRAPRGGGVPWLEEIARGGGAEAALAVESLGGIRHSDAVAALARVHETTPRLSSAVHEALGQMRSPAAADALVDLYDRGGASTGGSLLVALRAHASAVESKLRRRLRSADDAEVIGAVRLLGQVGSERSLTELLGLIRAERFSDDAILACLRVGGPRAVRETLPWMSIEWGASRAQEAVYSGWAGALDDAGREMLVRVASEKKGHAGQQAVALLARCGESGVDGLDRLLEKRRHVDRAIDSLASIGTSAAIDALVAGAARSVPGDRVLVRLLEDSDDEIAGLVLRGYLEREGENEARRLLARLERSPVLRGRLRL